MVTWILPEILQSSIYANSPVRHHSRAPSAGLKLRQDSSILRVMNYKVVVHREPEGGYWAEVPALPGCVSQGETLQELQANVREAMTGYLEVLRELV